MTWLHRHVRSSRLEDRQDGHDHLGRALQADAHTHLRSDAQLPQVARKLIGPGVQLAAGHVPAGPGERHRPRRSIRPRLEQLVQAGAGRLQSRAERPVGQELLALHRGQERQAEDRADRIGNRLAQQGTEIAG